MKALTLWQPWASLVALGAKRIETRSWSTTYRGPLAIHAAARKPEVPNEDGWIGAYNLGRWADDLRHADPCDCDEDEEQAGDRCLANSEWSHAIFTDAGAHGFALATTLPLGAVVATCNLVDVVPIVDLVDLPDGPFVYCDGDWLQVHDGPDDSAPRYSESEQLCGDFAPGRFAWLLDDIEPLAEPVPAKGRQGLWEWAL